MQETSSYLDTVMLPTTVVCGISLKKSLAENVCISSVIKQKGESQNGCLKKTKHANFSEKQKFLTPWYAYVRVHIILDLTP